MARDETHQGFDVAAAFGGGVLGLVIAAALIAVAGVVLSMSTMPARYLGTSTGVISWLTVLLAGFVGARRAGRGAIAHGAVAGAIFVLLAVFLGSVVFRQGLSGQVLLVRLAIALAVGALGGLLGVGV